MGYTTDVLARVKKHNSGGVKSTEPRRLLTLIFCEHYLFEEDARKREMYFKTTMGKKAIKLMLKSTLEKMGHKNLSLKTLKIEADSEDVLSVQLNTS